MPERRAALIRGLVIAVLGVGVSCARTDAASPKVEQVMSQVLAVGCRIRVTAEGEAIRIEAVATSRADVNGSYRLDIRKNSADGSSHNIQSGKFSLEADKEEILSTTFLGASDAGHFQARLVIDSNSGSVSCIAP
jgi:hypothetical protein